VSQTIDTPASTDSGADLADLQPPAPSRIPPQGEGGFSESWYVVALSDEVGVGQVVGKDFLHGRVVVYRGDDGVPRVRSAYCRHLGSDLAVGAVVGNNLQCAFHHWQYGPSGRCSIVPAGDEPPRRARLFPFPTVERWGLIWAYNGLNPAFDLPGFPDHRPEDFEYRVWVDPHEYRVDPYVIFSNALDLQHLRVVHGLTVHGDPTGMVQTAHGIEYDIHLSDATLGDMHQHVAMTGTNIFRLCGQMAGMTSYALASATPTRKGLTQNYSVTLCPRDAGPPEMVEQVILMTAAFAQGLVEDDAPVLSTVHFRGDTLLSGPDQYLLDYLKFVRTYPRSTFVVPFLS
jgi:nitrite reductase/ring-hydroxylating ferredoxin subunit